jgi:hypothetical protein
MGGLCDSSPDPVPTSTTVVSGTEIPEWVSAGGQRLFGEAENLATKPYQPYSGGRVAGLSDKEKQGGALVSSNVGKYGSDISGARDLINEGSINWTDPGVSDRYINPFTRGVTDIAARETERRNLAGAPGRGASAVSSGAFGGARHGVNDAENRRNLSQAISDIYMRGGAEAWNQGRQQFNTDAGRKLTSAGALSGLAQTGQAVDTRDVQNLMTTGALERGVEQQSLDTAYGDFREQREWPYKQLNFALGALAGTPYEVQNNQTTSGTALMPGQNYLNDAAGLGLAGAGIYSMLGG